LLLQCYKDDKVNENEMSEARGTYGREGKYMRVFCGNAERGDHLEDQGVDVRILGKWILTKEDRRAWAASVCFTKGKCGRFLYTQ
jgi:hypothetical protein